LLFNADIGKAIGTLEKEKNASEKMLSIFYGEKWRQIRFRICWRLARLSGCKTNILEMRSLAATEIATFFGYS
jgi:hypothetical protein